MSSRLFLSLNFKRYTDLLGCFTWNPNLNVKKERIAFGILAKQSSRVSDLEHFSPLYTVLKGLSFLNKQLCGVSSCLCRSLSQLHLPISYQWQPVAQGTQLPLCLHFACQTLRGLNWRQTGSGGWMPEQEMTTYRFRNPKSKWNSVRAGEQGTEK